MKFNTVKLYFAEALVGIARNSFMAVSSALTVASCMLILIFSYCVVANIDFFLEQIESKTGITAFVDDSLTDEETESLRLRVARVANVAGVRLISREEALEIMAGPEDGERRAIIEGLADDNPLPRSFEITVVDAKAYDQALEGLAQLSDEGIYRVNSDSGAAAALVSFNNAARLVSVFVVLMLGFLSVVIVMNTIKLTLNSRQTDIGIMKYVGATDWFIKWPFIIEGAIIGLLGASLPAVICSAAYSASIGLIQGVMGEFSAIFTFRTRAEIFSVIAPAIFAFGSAIGVTGSMICVNRYLKV
jgi:cell division transport system permease protein